MVLVAIGWKTPEPPIGVGIVGLSAFGGWAAEAHVPALAELDGFELRGLVASALPAAKAASAKYDVAAAFCDVDELVHREDIDLVVVALRPPAQPRAVWAALAAGKMVLCEWPLGGAPGEAAKFAAAAAFRGNRTFLGLQARCAPALRHLTDLVRGGFVGNVLSTRMIAYTGGGDVDLLTGPFLHTIDAATMVLGDFVQVAAAEHDHLVVQGVLENDIRATLHFHPGPVRGGCLVWEIHGTEGDLVLSGNSGHLGQARTYLRGCRNSQNVWRLLPVPSRYELPLRDEAHRGRLGSAVTDLYAQILIDIVTDTRTVPDFAHATACHHLLERLERSCARRRSRSR
ncbi:Gfo/Idh/MocA family oxidoreductase [Nocardia sp. CDC159]|uniref:Gfo/Idh/MocA family oxidoreductase n=1 Tax=Nocardia pulmonis TaxID=2951408 RepID=A0A9X2EIA7_9NOCA|nr:MULTISPECIES: Gfo/Idh/MocA family oxidoreductase [Nocardia]MCM6778561.1 Gfo/Idh/MocA family oxidoreductase [Nocardia pulmonis]MCM6791450.1 Gfo/Idh/MocA family oxidoreductase [Nocardia sp. CDC159]